MKPEAIQRLVAREEARRGRGEADSWLDRNSWERCISRTLPVAMIPNLYNNNYQILQTPDYVVIQMEMIHEARIIPLDGRPHASERIRQWLGDSRGHWEGKTLVVETINFNDKLDGGDLQPSHVIQTGHRGSGKTLRLVERFTRINADTIDYRFTVEDPATFTRPYTVAIPMRKAPERRSDLRVRLPRGEPCHVEHSQRRPGQRAGSHGGCAAGLTAENRGWTPGHTRTCRADCPGATAIKGGPGRSIEVSFAKDHPSSLASRYRTHPHESALGD